MSVQGLQHLTATFEAAEKAHRDLMEPYSCRLADASADERAEIMRAGLRETFRRRYPMPAGFAWPKAEAEPA